MNVDLYKRFFRDVEYRDHHDSLRPYTVLTVQGRQYPVEILYSASPVANYVESTASVVLPLSAHQTVIRIHNSTLRGDILAFLPSEETVEACKATLVERSASARTRNGQLWVVTLWVIGGSLIPATAISPPASSGRSSKPLLAGFGRWCWRRV